MAYAKRTQTTGAMAEQLVASYDGKTYSAPTMTDADARAFCAKACFSSAGEQSAVVPVYETDGKSVKPCPTMNGTQTFPFPTGEEVSDPVCEKAGDGLVATKNMILAGKGDDGICRIENVDQENQGKVVRKALDQTLQETDLRTIRKEIAKVAQRVAQSGFPFAQYGNVQNLSKRLVQAARTIRSKAAQDCGGDQSMRNLAMKVCRNVAINGKAMPCVLNKASQLNVAAQAGECLQQVMVKTKAMQEAVSMVEATSTLTLDNPTTVSTAKAINLGILAVLLTVGVIVIVAVLRRPTRGILGRRRPGGHRGRLLGLVHRPGQPESSPQQGLPDLRGHQASSGREEDGTFRDHCRRQRRLRPRRGVPWVGLRIHVQARGVRGGVLRCRNVPRRRQLRRLLPRRVRVDGGPRGTSHTATW